MGLNTDAQQQQFNDGEIQLRSLKDVAGIMNYGRRLAGSRLSPLRSTGISVLQVNVGKLCNMHCRHCHVEAGPDRPELTNSNINFGLLTLPVELLIQLN